MMTSHSVPKLRARLADRRCMAELFKPSRCPPRIVANSYSMADASEPLQGDAPVEGAPATPHRRRPRYSGKNPRRFEEKYKEHNPERYAETVAKVIASGKTPAGTHRPIMVAEILEVLSPRPGAMVVDCTL